MMWKFWPHPFFSWWPNPKEIVFGRRPQSNWIFLALYFWPSFTEVRPTQMISPTVFKVSLGGVLPSEIFNFLVGKILFMIHTTICVVYIFLVSSLHHAHTVVRQHEFLKTRVFKISKEVMAYQYFGIFYTMLHTPSVLLKYRFFNFLDLLFDRSYSIFLYK